MNFAALARITVGMYGSILELTTANRTSATTAKQTRFLLVNGAIVLFLGILSGTPFCLAIILG